MQAAGSVNKAYGNLYASTPAAAPTASAVPNPNSVDIAANNEAPAADPTLALNSGRCDLRFFDSVIGNPFL